MKMSNNSSKNYSIFANYSMKVIFITAIVTETRLLNVICVALVNFLITKVLKDT